MKIEIEIECSPEEARRFLGLPDVTKANGFYADAIAKAVQGAGSLDQLQEVARGFAPMGQIGLKIFQEFMDAGGKAAGRKKAGG